MMEVKSLSLNVTGDDDNEDSQSSLHCVMEGNQLKFIPVEDDVNEENKARESWNRKSSQQRKSNSNLIPNTHLRHVNLSNISRNTRSMAILKNGSCFKELKSIKCTTEQSKVILSNTCTFDSLTSLIMVWNYFN